jgi:hypothetical protein
LVQSNFVSHDLLDILFSSEHDVVLVAMQPNYLNFSKKLLKIQSFCFKSTGAWTLLNPLGTVAPVGLCPRFKSNTDDGAPLFFVVVYHLNYKTN